MEEKTKEKTQETKETKETKETTKENRLMKTVEDSRTEQVHLIMHQHLNAGGRLFGGMLMQWVDEVSGVVAMRHLVNRAFSVMVAVDKDERPTRIPGLIIHTEAEKGRHEAALLRRDMRKERRDAGF